MMKKNIVVFLIILVLLLALNPVRSRAFAQSDLSFRLSQLESEVLNLKSQISRLQYQSSNGTRLSRQTLPQERRASRQVSSKDPMFDRLATLVIELKEDIRNIEKRLAKLES